MDIIIKRVTSLYNVVFVKCIGLIEAQTLEEKCSYVTDTA